LCYVVGEIKDISATLANHCPEVELKDADGKSQGMLKKTAHDYISMTGRLEGGGVVDVTYAPALSRTGRDFYWEITGSEGSLVLEGGKMGGHVQMFQPTVKLAMEGQEGLEDVQLEKAADFSFNVGKAWEAWAGVGLDQGYSVTTFEDALIRHKMIEAIYRSAEKGTRENYL
jgi:predicted dehydrogenase